MAGLYLLDANIVIAALREQPLVLRRLETASLAELRLSTIVLGELEYGAEKSAYGPRNRARLSTMVGSITNIGVDPETALRYGRLRAHLERQGTPIGANDLWIAAQALAIGATVVTANEREFRRVPDLKVENWLSA
ncbi:PIN domain-containing protein [Chelatococcus sambhunathii]|uniref:Ribonuclease VapC n=1 Tax=Chelatococcus sambhunathii TaxID=363953 RepID=A0ABU1DHP5_9HYPH|nr:PIN domain-containing protein [Chelatococcus sambhunathii]MDR4307519.1 PIN domain-containing protein [Chelatococcus sambhunathii]